MAILGVGTDILFLPRIAAIVERRSAERFASRILSAGEHDHWRALNNPPEKLQFLGVRWSVKEAAYKALQPSLKPTWKDISFLKENSTSHKPVLRMVRGDSRRIDLHASVSHDGDHVIAMVIAEANEIITD